MLCFFRFVERFPILQLEYCYPPLPLIENQSAEISVLPSKTDEGPELSLPDAWKHLPSLGLPDGAHRFQSGILFKLDSF